MARNAWVPLPPRPWIHADSNQTTPTRKLGMKNLMLDHVGYQLWICHLWQKKKRQGKSMQFFNVWYFGELPQSAETQNYTGCHRDPRCISIAGFMEDTIPGRSFQDEHFSDIRTGFQSMAKTADWVSMIWRFPKMGLPWNHPGYFRIFHYEPAIGDPPCLYMKFHGLPVADARRFWLNLGIDTVVKWYTEPWTDGGVNMGFSKSIAYPKNLGLNKSQLHTITMIL